MTESGAADVPTVAPLVVNGFTVLLRTLTSERLAALLVWRRAHRGDVAGLMFRLIAASVVDADSNPRFTVEDATRLPMPITCELADAIVTRNKMW